MDLQDYLLDHEGFDWARLLASWAWLLPRELTVWVVNRFGDLFVVLDDGSVWRLDLGAGTFEKTAADRDEFCDHIDEGDNADTWLLVPLVDRLVAAGKVLSPGRCYGFRIPPVVGGAYSVDNINPLPVAEVYGWSGSFHEQIRDLPDGAEIELKVIDST